MVNKRIIIGHLYPKQMNVYGDMGNIITLRYRLQSRGYTVEYVEIDSLHQLSKHNIDLLVGGGGQDSNQMLVKADLQKYSKEIRQRCEDGLVTLMICGMYQLFGNTFILADGSSIPGVGIIDMETHATDKRLIGNIVIKSEWGKMVGFENHSGRTVLGAGTKPLGRVIKGAGNNGDTNDEGAVVNNVFGTYMHGPALTKNPSFADELISRVLERKYGVDEPLIALNDFIELQAASAAMRRPH